MAWPRSFIDQVRRSADPMRIVGEVVSLKKRGTRWVGLCPFHQEKTPSFGVSDEGLWYCFGCGEGGDIFKFVMQYEGLGFQDAVRSVAERAGVPVPEQESRARPSDSREDGEVARERVLAVLQAAQEHYVENLRGERGARAREYLAQRGIDEAIIESFGLGYALSSWEALHRRLTGASFSPRELVAAGVAKRRGDGSGIYDLLRDRIVFPIRDPRGRPLAFGGRVLESGEPKYLNSPETRVFHKSRTLYGLGEAREALRGSGFAILVEGYLDLLACVQHGHANVVAPLGTAFTADHARQLSHHARKVVLAFDGDEAGQAAAERTVGTFLAAGFQVAVLRLPAGQDPDSFLREEGPEAFRRALRAVSPALSFLVDRVSTRADVRTPQGKAQALASLLGFVLELSDRVERAEWIGRIAAALDIQEHLVVRTFAELRERGRRPGPPITGERPPGELATTARRFDTIPLAERDLLCAVLRTPSWLPKLRQIFGDGAVRDARVEALLEGIDSLLSAGHGDGPVEAARLLERVDVPGADTLLSRLVVEGDTGADWDYARSCALGMRRDALRRQLRDVQRQIEEMQRAGEEVEDLQRRHMELAQEIRAGRPSPESGG